MDIILQDYLEENVDPADLVALQLKNEHICKATPGALETLTWCQWFVKTFSFTQKRELSDILHAYAVRHVHILVDV